MATRKERIENHNNKLDPLYPFKVALKEINEKVNTIKLIPGYTPVKGKDYFTEGEIVMIINHIQSHVKNGMNGKDGIKGEVGKSIKGDRGNDGYSPIREIDYWTAADQEKIIRTVLLNIPKPKDGVTPEIDNIVNKVVDILKQNPVELKDIKGADKLIEFLKIGGFRGGGDTVLAGANITIVPNASGQKVISATGLSIGGTIAGGTANSVLFINPNNTLAQDNANFNWNDTNLALTIGNSVTNGNGQTIINGGTLAGLSANNNFFNIIGTLPAVTTTTTTGVNFLITSAGSSASKQIALQAELLAGYTGSAQTKGLNVSNIALGTGVTGFILGSSNIGTLSQASSSGTGNNVGIGGAASGSSSLNLGSVGNAISSINSPVLNIGTSGLAFNATTNVGGFFGLMNAAPTLGTSSALIADNGATHAAIFQARSNGTPVVSIDDVGRINVVNIQDTEYNILALTPTKGLLAWATDLGQFMVANGTNWYIDSSYLVKDLQNPDMGYIQGSNRVGYGQSYVTDKTIANSALGDNANAVSGGVRYNPTGNSGTPSIQAYLNGAWRNFVSNLNEVEVNAILEQAPPVGYTQTIQVFSGNSTLLGLNGIPIIQGYMVSMGAYPVQPQVNGGTF